ncbi:MAG TPA: alpha/beta hydrolase [Candidatus Omnitrophota bacterium]|nr:alpha/beta hydrolase [Candidatus Omnitrophota bacterium]HPD84677.1 alpha/beta hydrolase [Candidatus Omnitrophota bacterium]HRZ03535.1 alpha/beta hydrolase [Candidatus Omnitrophota bacterium]
MPTLKTPSGIIWHYDLEGEGSEFLLFLHGWGVDKRIWRQQSKYFSQGYKVLTIDLPGHGESSWQKVSLSVMAQDLKSILDGLQIREITIVASSIGGIFSLRLYQACASNIKKIIFVGSMPKFSKSRDYPFGLDVAQIRKLGQQLRTTFPSVINIFFRSLFTKEERASRRFKWLQRFRQNDQAPMREALLEYLDILEQEDLRDVLKSVTVPVQFINGTGDTICNRETVGFLRAMLPRARFDDFAGCGHFPFLSKPHEFNAVLEDFLKTA